MKFKKGTVIQLLNSNDYCNNSTWMVIKDVSMQQLNSLIFLQNTENKYSIVKLLFAKNIHCKDCFERSPNSICSALQYVLKYGGRELFYIHVPEEINEKND